MNFRLRTPALAGFVGLVGVLLLLVTALSASAGNVSTLNEFSLSFVNRVDGSQLPADGQRVQYRGLLSAGEMVPGALKTLSDDPVSFRPNPDAACWR